MKTRLTLLLLALALTATAQNISVASFRLAENDLTANTHGTEVKDQNGNTCALIKVETTQTGFTFDVGVMGVTKTEQHTGEVWVYVPFGVKRITIQHQQLGTLRDYYFPCAIEEARTYIMQLTTGEVKTVVKQEVGGSYLMMTIDPKNATVYIDDEMKSVSNGEVMLILPYGRHTYRVEAASYMTDAGSFEIGKERKEISVSLASARAIFSVSCPDKEANLFINDKEIGKGSWTGNLDAGMYIVEARKKGHRTEMQSLSLAKQEQRTISLNASQPIYGDLNLQSSPGNCEVYIDNKLIGKSPDIFKNLLIGTHKVELKREGYEPASQQITIEEGKTAELAITLEEDKGGKPLTFTVKGVTFKMMPVAGGTFTMGATSEQSSDAWRDEKPTHCVTLSDFYMGETEVTQALWQAVMGSNPSHLTGNDQRPVRDVDWYDCQAFITKLNSLLSSQLNGKQFRLPTEAEWEYAARGGKQSHGYRYSGSNKIKKVAWYSDFGSSAEPNPVAQKQANELGLYDMSGNVEEWCQDWYGDYSSSAQTNPTGPSEGSFRVYRGGCWYGNAGDCRVSNRDYELPALGSLYGALGLRLSLR